MKDTLRSGSSKRLNPEPTRSRNRSESSDETTWTWLEEQAAKPAPSLPSMPTQYRAEAADPFKMSSQAGAAAISSHPKPPTISQRMPREHKPFATTLRTRGRTEHSSRSPVAPVPPLKDLKTAPTQINSSSSGLQYQEADYSSKKSTADWRKYADKIADEWDRFNDLLESPNERQAEVTRAYYSGWEGRRAERKALESQEGKDRRRADPVRHNSHSRPRQGNLTRTTTDPTSGPKSTKGFFSRMWEEYEGDKAERSRQNLKRNISAPRMSATGASRFGDESAFIPLNSPPVPSIPHEYRQHVASIKTSPGPRDTKGKGPAVQVRERVHLPNNRQTRFGDLIAPVSPSRRHSAVPASVQALYGGHRSQRSPRSPKRSSTSTIQSPKSPQSAKSNKSRQSSKMSFRVPFLSPKRNDSDASFFCAGLSPTSVYSPAYASGWDTAQFPQTPETPSVPAMPVRYINEVTPLQSQQRRMKRGNSPARLNLKDARHYAESNQNTDGRGAQSRAASYANVCDTPQKSEWEWDSDESPVVPGGLPTPAGRTPHTPMMDAASLPGHYEVMSSSGDTNAQEKGARNTEFYDFWDKLILEPSANAPDMGDNKLPPIVLQMVLSKTADSCFFKVKDRKDLSLN